MAQKTMYPAMSGSPNTTTTAAIGVSDTEIAVAELSVLPAAPNICILYVSSTKWERCLYSAKSNASGAGTITVARSGDGHASTDGSNGPLEFDSGAKVMRNFTAYDHDLFRENILDLEARKITSTGVLTAFAGITTAANKLPYATGEDAFDVCDFTSLGRSLIGTTTASAVRDLIASASSTTATQNIYVDAAATGTGTGVDWANAFTTIQRAVNSLPAIVNHAVTIWIRKGATPYAENVTIQRVVAAGSITIRGEYYWWGTVAATATGKITLGSGNTGYADRAQIAAGDQIWATKWSGAIGASTPEESIIDTVASVSGAEVTLTTNTGKSLDSTWTYQIVNTAINGAITINNTDTMLVLGLKGSALNLSNSQGWRSSVCYFEHISNVVYATSSSNLISGQFAMQRCCIVYSSAGGNGVPVALIGCNTFNAQNIFASAGGIGSTRGIFQQMGGYTQINNCHVMGLSGGSQSGIHANNNGYVYLSNCLIDGFDASNKLTNGLYALNGGVLQVFSGVTIGSNVTTQKNPANWAATTDGSYIS